MKQEGRVKGDVIAPFCTLVFLVTVRTSQCMCQ